MKREYSTIVLVFTEKSSFKGFFFHSEIPDFVIYRLIEKRKEFTLNLCEM